MNIVIPWRRKDKIARHPVVQQLQRDVATIQRQQHETDVRQLELERMFQRVIDQLATIIDQNDKIVRALYASGLLNGNDR